MRYLTILTVFLLAICCVTSAFANRTADSIAAQARLTDASNNPVPDGTIDVIISIWTDSVGGTMLHSQTNVVTTIKGLFTTCVGCGVSSFFDIFTDISMFMQVQLAGQDPMTPRIRISSAPFAITASGLESEVTNGTARGRGIVSVKSASGSGSMTNGMILLDADSDGDGVAEASDSAGVNEGSAGRRLQVHNLGSSGEDGVEISAQSAGRRLAVHNLGSSGEDGVDITAQSASRRLVVHNLGSSGQDGVSMSAKPDSGAVVRCDSDSDGDGHSEARAAVSSVGNLAGGGGGAAAASYARFTTDSNDDGVPDDEASFSVTPGTSSVAIKTKGTGADANRTASISSSTTVGGISTICAIDENGDGAPEYKESVSLGLGFTAVKGTFSAPSRVHPNTTNETSASELEGLCRVAADSDDDGLSDADASLSVTPTTSSVAIKTKGTGADANRTAIISTTGLDSASTVSTHDSDGNGIPEVSIECKVGLGVVGGAVPGASILSSALNSSGARIAGSNIGINETLPFALLFTDVDGDGTAENSVSLSANSSGASQVTTAGSKNIGLYVNEVSGQCKLQMVDAGSGTQDTTIVIDGALKRFGIGISAPEYPLHHSSGAHLTAGGVWTNASDANLKENFRPVDGEEILDKVDALPITEWNYKAESEDIKHIGPTAQDFQQVFGVGSDGRSISTIDPSGIALAAIKELSKKVKEVDKLKSEVRELKALVQKLTADNVRQNGGH